MYAQLLSMFWEQSLCDQNQDKFCLVRIKIKTKWMFHKCKLVTEHFVTYSFSTDLYWFMDDAVCLVSCICCIACDTCMTYNFYTSKLSTDQTWLNPCSWLFFSRTRRYLRNLSLSVSLSLARTRACSLNCITLLLFLVLTSMHLMINMMPCWPNELTEGVVLVVGELRWMVSPHNCNFKFLVAFFVYGWPWTWPWLPHETSPRMLISINMTIQKVQFQGKPF